MILIKWKQDKATSSLKLVNVTCVNKKINMFMVAINYGNLQVALKCIV